MTDAKLEQIKLFFSNYSSKEDFVQKYIKVYNPANAEAVIQLFEETKENDETWELAKFQRSIETLRLDKIVPQNQNITIQDIITTAKKYDLSKYKRVMIKLDNKNYDDIEELLNLGVDVYIKLSGDKGLCTLDEFKNMRKFFNDFNNKYSTYNLSNLEKITLAYDCVKFFFYNEEQNGRLIDSRSIAHSINSGNIVCEGYSRIFCQLLREMGINSNLVFIKPNDNEKGGHVRVILKVDDEKYNISDVFAFDPTWDSNQNTSFIIHSDETTGYEIESWLKQDDRVLEKMPSDIRYLFFMVPLQEYSKYFSREKIEKYPSGELIPLTDELITVLNYNENNAKDPFIFNFIQELLYKTKKIEGYNNEQIESFIHHAIELLRQDRFGRFNNKRKSNYTR